MLFFHLHPIALNTKWTTDDAFIFGGTIDLFFISTVITNACTFLIRNKKGAHFVIKQIVLIGISAVLFITRDLLVLSFKNKNSTALIFAAIA